MPGTSTDWGPPSWKAAFIDGPKGLGGQADREPAMCPQSKDSQQLGSVTRRSREVLLSLCSEPVRNIWSAGSSPELPSMRDMGMVKQVQQRAMKTIKGLEHPLHKEKLREMGTFSMEKRRLRGILSIFINT